MSFQADTLISELVLIEKGYDTVPRKVEKAMREVDAANQNAIKSTREVSEALVLPEAPNGLQRLAKEAKAVADEMSRSSSVARVWAASGNGRIVQRADLKNSPIGRTAGPRDPYATNANVAVVGNQIFRLNQGGASSKPSATHGATFDFGGVAGIMEGVGESFKGVAGAIPVIGGLVASIAAMGAVAASTGFRLMKASAEFDSLRKSLESIEGEKGSNRALRDLKQLAKAPGLGFEEAVSAYSGLRNAELSEDFAKKVVKEWSNANARGGGNAETFGRIMLQLRQAAGREFLQQEDLSPIMEAGVPVNALLKKRYGTGDTEELKSRGITAKQTIRDLTEELAKMPRVAGGYANSLDNLADAIKYAEVSAGDAVNKAFLPLGEEFAEALSKLNDGGEVTAALEVAAQNLRDIFNIDRKGMTEVLREMLVGVRDMSTAARNLALNTAGAAEDGGNLWTWLSDTLGWAAGTNVAPWDSDYEAWRQSNSQTDLSASGEAKRNAKDAAADQWIAENGRGREAQEELQEAQRNGFRGTTKQWRALKQDERDSWLSRSNTGANKQAAEAKSASALSPEERTARATEQLVAYKKRQFSIQPASAGGGELARMGVAATELSGNAAGSRDRKLMQAVKLISEWSAIKTSDRQVSDARHSSRTY